MPITATDIEFRQSGTNNLGGAISATAVSSSVNAFFDVVSGAEAAAGDTEYRCFYVRNSHASLTLLGAKIWISANTPAPGSSVEIGLGTSAIGGTEQTIANEDTAPTGVTFSTAANEASALTIGDIPAGSHKAIWIKRIISAGAGAYNNDSAEVTVKGETAA